MPSRREVWAKAATGSAMRNRAERTIDFDMRNDIDSSLLKAFLLGSYPSHDAETQATLQGLFHHNAVFAGVHPRSNAVLAFASGPDPSMDRGVKKPGPHFHEVRGSWRSPGRTLGRPAYLVKWPAGPRGPGKGAAGAPRGAGGPLLPDEATACR